MGWVLKGGWWWLAVCAAVSAAVYWFLLTHAAVAAVALIGFSLVCGAVATALRRSVRRPGLYLPAGRLAAIRAHHGAGHRGAAFRCAECAPVYSRRAPVRVRPEVRALPAPPRQLEAPVTVTVLPVREEAPHGLQRQQPVQR